jgi:hypothetical protein
MSTTTDSHLAAILTAGNSPDGVLLEWAGKALPADLQGLHGAVLAALRLVRGLTRQPRPDLDTLARLTQSLETAARGGAGSGLAADLAAEAIVLASPSVAAMSASLLQAARRELLLARRGEPLFAGWSDFYSHARFALVPAGRVLLDGAGIDEPAALEAADALMTAAALIGALQEAGERCRRNGTIGLPLQWLRGADGVQALAARRCSPALRKAFDRGIDRGHELLAIAGPARGLDDLGPYAARLLLLGRRLLGRMKRRDPLAQAIALGWLDSLALRLARLGP